LRAFYLNIVVIVFMIILFSTIFFVFIYFIIYMYYSVILTVNGSSQPVGLGRNTMHTQLHTILSSCPRVNR